jgi:ethylbenzene dioxygenase ferredoxin subunit
MALTFRSDSRQTASELVLLCRADDVVEGQPVAANPDNFPPLAVYKIGDDHFVTNNICTHSYSLLTEGFQEEEEIECAVHGGMFDIRTGEATAFPCRTPLKTYRVTIVNGWVAIPAADAQSTE